MNGGAVTCKRCGAEVHPLEVFPGTVCLECHARAHENDTPAELMRDIVRGFGGR
jgi:hypothetical protein